MTFRSYRLRFAFFVLFLLNFVFFHYAYGQSNDTQTADSENTRAADLKQQRLEKSKKLTPYYQSGTERGMIWLEEKGLSRTFAFNYHGVYPMLANIETGSGLAPAVRFWRPNIKGKGFFDVQALGAWSIRGYKLYELQFGKFDQRSTEYFLSANASGGGPQADIVEREKRSFFYADLKYRDFPQEDFFGLGPDSKKTDRTDYRLKESSYDGVFGYQFNQYFGAGVRIGISEIEIGEGTDGRFPNTQDVFTPITAPGLNDQPDFFHVSGALFFDYRDKRGNPHKGGLVGVSVSRFDDTKLNRFDFERFAFDTRQYIPLGSPQRVVALRFFTSHDNADANDRVPFYMQDTLGGSQTLRGYREFRFRDPNLIYLSAEYRWEAAPAIEGAFFYDAGKVYPEGESFSFDHLKRSWGFGVRFKTRNSVVLRIDVGKSNEGRRIFFKYAPSF